VYTTEQLLSSRFSAHVRSGQILDDYARKMRDAENESHEGKRRTESLWPIMRISHTRSRYIYELYYKRDAISKALYDWLLKEGYADAK
jgi:bud site selection protein 31